MQGWCWCIKPWWMTLRCELELAHGPYVYTTPEARSPPLISSSGISEYLRVLGESGRLAACLLVAAACAMDGERVVYTEHEHAHHVV